MRTHSRYLPTHLLRALEYDVSNAEAAYVFGVGAGIRTIVRYLR